MRFIATGGNITSAVLVKFLNYLLYSTGRPVFLVLDNHFVHRTTEVYDFIKSTKGRLRLFFLPPCSPKHNPDKHAWNYPKNQKIGKLCTKNIFELLKRVESP
jgi:transposase